MDKIIHTFFDQHYMSSLPVGWKQVLFKAHPIANRIHSLPFHSRLVRVCKLGDRFFLPKVGIRSEGHPQEHT